MQSMPPRRRALRAAVLFNGFLLALLVAGLSSRSSAQEVPRPSYARQVQQQSAPSIANFRVGEVMLRVEASAGMTFVDNVNLSPHGSSDLIVSPQVSIDATWAVTKLNTLQFRVGMGYMYYFNHPLLNRQQTTITPDSAVSFNVYAGDVKINFHDQFSLQQDTIGQGALSGVATLQRFTNTAGLSVLWDTNDVVWSLGYDHYNFITLGGANSSSGSVATSISRLDHSTDQISASTAVKLSSVLIGGIEGTYAHSTYPQETASNYTAISAGPYLEFQLTRYTHVYMSGGYKAFYSGANAPGSVAVNSTSAAQPARGNPTGGYVNLSLVHRLNKYYSDHLDIGHTDDVDAINGHSQVNSIRYGGTWRASQNLTLTIGAFYEDVHILAGSALGGTPPSDYSRVGASLSTGYQISRHVGMSLAYQFVKKAAVLATQDYTQNQVTFSIGYHF